MLIILPALSLLRFLTNGPSFCTKRTHLEYGTSLPWMLRDDCINCIPKSVLNSFDYGILIIYLGFPGDSEVKASASITGDLGSIPGLGRSPGEGKGYPLQYSGLENSMDWMLHGVTKS